MCAHKADNRYGQLASGCARTLKSRTARASDLEGVGLHGLYCDSLDKFFGRVASLQNTPLPRSFFCYVNLAKGFSLSCDVETSACHLPHYSLNLAAGLPVLLDVGSDICHLRNT